MNVEFKSIMAKLRGAKTVTADLLPPMNWLPVPGKRHNIEAAIYYDEGNSDLRSLIMMSAEGTDLVIRVYEQPSYHRSESDTVSTVLTNAKIVQLTTKKLEESSSVYLSITIEYDGVELQEEL